MARRGGQPGNLNAIKGQPRFITDALIRHLLEEVKDPRACATPDEAKIQRRRVDFMVSTLTRLALDGDTAALRMIMDRVEGSALQTMQFRPMTEQEETAKLAAVHEKIKGKSFDELAGLYREAISAGTPTLGSA